MEAVARQLAEGTMLDDKYRIERLLAVGGMGAVCVGTHVKLRKKAQVVQLSARVYVPSGQPAQQVRLYRNSREDVLFTAIATAGALFERAITIDALAGERLLLAIAPTTMGAADVGVHLYVHTCIDGRRVVGSLTVPACKLQGTYAPRFGRNVKWLTAGAYFDGAVDDVRAFTTALPCE